MNKLFNFFYYILVFFVILLSIRGVSGNPTKGDINSNFWKEDGPFELSPERGRFALTFSLVEDKSFSFDIPLASFALPDLGYIDGKYVSLFAPGVSLLVIPGYYLGKLFGLAQLGVFAVVSFFAVLNVALIRAIAQKLGAKKLYSSLASFIFLFATPAYTYAVSLYQHHISVFLILSGIFVYLSYKSFFSNMVIWFLIFVSFFIDYPNFFMMIPLILVLLLRAFELKETKDLIKIKFRYLGFFSVVGAFLPLLFFGWVNYKTYGSPFRLAGTVENVRQIDSNGMPVREFSQEASKLEEYRVSRRQSNSVALGFFDTRNIPNGLYVHFFSPDRGIIFYTPVILFSLFGIAFLYKKNAKAITLLSAIALINVFIYSMWGDPWGGWAFGSRYLIPFYAVASIIVSFALEKILQRKILLLLFLLIFVYSVFINTLGAITTSANPPKVEVSGVEEVSGREEKYTFERNWDYLNSQGSKSFIYQKYLKDLISPLNYFILVSSIPLLFCGVLILGKGYFTKLVSFYERPVSNIRSGKIKDVIIDSKKSLIFSKG